MKITKLIDGGTFLATGNGRTRFQEDEYDLALGILAKAELAGIKIMDLADGEMGGGRGVWDKVANSSPEAKGAMLERAMKAMRFDKE